MDALAAAGLETRLVGGCVRDALAGRPIADIDLAVAAPPETVTAALDAAGIKALPTGIDHGVQMAVIAGRGYEIASLRADVATDGRRAVVAFTTDWRVDAARRDFTVNALSLARNGALHDPFGGAADLARGRLRFVGDADLRVREDALRILRFFRFFAHFGQRPADPEALAACADHADLLKTLAAERVTAELLKLLAAPDPGPALDLAHESGVLGRLLAFPANRERLARLMRFEAVTVGLDPIRRLAALHPPWTPADPTGLRLSAAQSKRLAHALDLDAPTPCPEVEGGDRWRLFHKLGAETATDRALLDWANGGGQDAGLPVRTGALERACFFEDWRALIAQADGWRDPRPPITGADALTLGAQGPAVGAALGQVTDWWLGEEGAPDRAACLARLKSIVRRSGIASEHKR